MLNTIMLVISFEKLIPATAWKPGHVVPTRIKAELGRYLVTTDVKDEIRVAFPLPAARAS
jgi:hypothetical protein